MSKFRLDPVVFNFRAYDDEIDTSKFLSEESIPYTLVGTVTISDTEAYISATLGTFSPQVLLDLSNELYKYGVKKMHWRHNDKKITKEIEGVF